MDHFDISSDLRVILKTPVIADHPQAEIFNLHCKVQTLLNLNKCVHSQPVGSEQVSGAGWGIMGHVCTPRVLRQERMKGAIAK